MDANHLTYGVPFTGARREMPSLLANRERRCLLWIAARLPARVRADHLTILALIAMFMAGASYWMARVNRWALVSVVFWLGVNWFGDSLDGTLARVRRHERPRYGFYVDHVVDCFGALFLVSGLAMSGYMSPHIAMGVLVAYLLVCIEVYLAAYCVRVFRIAFWGVGPTELRLILAVGTLALWSDPHVPLPGGDRPLFDVGGITAIAAMGFTLLTAIAGNLRTLSRAEPLPGR